MEKILTLGKTESAFITALGFEFVQLPRFTNDEDRHDFVLGTLKAKEFDKLLILIDSEDGYDGLKLGLHIRLTLDLHRKRLVPLLFISTDTLAVVLRNAGVWGRILTTKGCKLERPDVVAIQTGVEFPALPIAEIGAFLSLIQLRPDETTGRHSLANEWGAYALDKAAGTRALKNNSFLQKARKQLYFKYVEALNYNSDNLIRPASTMIELEKPKPNRINAIGKKVLLIDDEAEKGWSDVLSVLFNTSNPNLDFQVFSRKVSGWQSLSEDEKSLILNSGFDLFLIDLRLTGSEEEDNSTPENFSGTHVMRHIKQSNAGNQVIMFTASNKAWNLKALLNFGADGYYIKESPEYNFPERFSDENLKVLMNEAKTSLEKDYLRIIFTQSMSLKIELQNKKKNKLISKEVVAEISRYLDFAFDSLGNYKTRSSSEIEFSVAYTFLFLILEALSKQLINHESPFREGDTYKFQFRKDEIFLKYFDPYSGKNTGKDLEIITKNHKYIPSISYTQQVSNLFYISGLSSEKIVPIVEKRNAFQHPNLIENKQFTNVSKQDVIDVFEIVYVLTLKL